LLQLGTFFSLQVLPAVWISAGGKYLSACGNGKSAGRKSFSHRVEEVVERQKEKACYNVRTTGTFYITWVTSEPTRLQDTPHFHVNIPWHPLSRRTIRLNLGVDQFNPGD
jgi:hypothetical protein